MGIVPQNSNHVYLFHKNDPFDLISLLYSQRNFPSCIPGAHLSLIKSEEGMASPQIQWATEIVCPVRTLTDPLNKGQRTSQPHVTVRLHSCLASHFYFISSLRVFIYYIFIYIYFYFFAHLLGNRRRVFISHLNQAM